MSNQRPQTSFNISLLDANLSHHAKLMCLISPHQSIEFLTNRIDLLGLTSLLGNFCINVYFFPMVSLLKINRLFFKL